MARKENDLTQGNIWKSVIRFAVPLMVAQLFQQLYNATDVYVAGNYISSDALGAVSASADVSNLVVTFFNGLSTGLTVAFGIYFGAKNYEKLHDSIHTAIAFIIFGGGILSMIGFVFSPQLIQWISVDPDIADLSLQYLRIYMFSALFTAIYNALAAVIRSLGDSNGPLYFLMSSCAINYVLDMFFVNVLNMGVIGLSWATVIAQAVCVTLAFRRLMRVDEKYCLRIKDLRIDWSCLLELMEYGLPAAIQSCISSIAGTFTSKWKNSFGKYASSGIGTGMKIDQFAGITSTAIGNAIPSFVAQNVGAKKYDRAVEGFKKCFILCELIVIPMGILIYIFARPLITIFTTDENVIAVAEGFLHTAMPLYCFMGAQHVYAGVVRGFGHSTASMLLNMIGSVGFRQLYLNVVLNIDYDIKWMFFCYPATWISATIFCATYYYLVIYRNIKKGDFEAVEKHRKKKPVAKTN